MLETRLIPAKEEKSKWLMFVMHGLGDSMNGYSWMPSEMQLPWMNYLLINAPDEYYGGYSWFDLYGEPAPGIDRSRKLLTQLLDQKCNEGFSPENIYLFGFSQGCLMTLETGLCYPQKLAGLIGISGFIHDLEGLINRAASTARQQRLLVTHGTYDPLLPFSTVKNQIQKLKELGYDIQWHEFQKEHTIAGEEELRVIREFTQKPYLESQK
ncbi:MAG: alpha/beta hydrolase [Limisphaerales bacterium]|jgi:phospholipase/carboxylesterase|nr:serine esterase [Verrucomicrobiota bacterium]